jgi:hypothetical protein
LLVAELRVRFLAGLGGLGLRLIHVAGKAGGVFVRQRCAGLYALLILIESPAPTPALAFWHGMLPVMADAL